MYAVNTIIFFISLSPLFSLKITFHDYLSTFSLPQPVPSLSLDLSHLSTFSLPRPVPSLSLDLSHLSTFSLPQPVPSLYLLSPSTCPPFRELNKFLNCKKLYSRILFKINWMFIGLWILSIAFLSHLITNLVSKWEQRGGKLDFLTFLSSNDTNSVDSVGVLGDFWGILGNLRCSNI